MSELTNYDVAVIGSGFGGLGAALTLAERGVRVALYETLKYPGGCAGTFTRKGYHFDAGATLSSGFGDRQLFRTWMDRYHLKINLEYLSTAIHFRSPEFNLDIPSDRDEMIDRFCKLPHAPQEEIRRFFAHQKSVADTLWTFFDDPDLLPPLRLNALWSHLKRTHRYLPLLLDINQSLFSVMQRYGLAQFSPLINYLNALCQITTQCSIGEVEAPLALATIDYYNRGTAHIKGGIGQLARGLCDAISHRGGEIRFTDKVSEIIPQADGTYLIKSRRGESRVSGVVLNALPETAQRLCPPLTTLPKWATSAQEEIKKGWGAAMLYLVAEDDEQFDEQAQHWQMVGDSSSPLQEGNHVFCSISSRGEYDRAPAGSRVMTLSTHVPMTKMRALTDDEKARYIEGIQYRMRETFNQNCPEWSDRVYFCMTGSPRTFERFTGRPEGLVGGPPRTKGLRHYLTLNSTAVMPRFYLTGDSFFPGQSTLATATGGARVAERLFKQLPLSQPSESILLTQAPLAKGER